MVWQINEQEFELVVSLPAPERYQYFIKRVFDRQEIWTLANADGLVLAQSPDGQEVLPVWPHPRYAEACAFEEWSDCQPRLIQFSDWLKKWLPGMTRDNRLLAVFPTPSDQAVVVPADRLEEDLQAYRQTQIS